MVDDGRAHEVCVFSTRIHVYPMVCCGMRIAYVCLSFILSALLYLLHNHHCRHHHQEKMIRAIKEFLLLLEGHKHCPKWWCYCILSLLSGMQWWYGSNNAWTQTDIICNVYINVIVTTTTTERERFVCFIIIHPFSNTNTHTHTLIQCDWKTEYFRFGLFPYYFIFFIIQNKYMVFHT